MAGVLHHLGIPTGPRAPKAAFAPESNPVGQFEDDEFVGIFNRMFGNWRFPHFWAPTEAHLEEIQALVGVRDETSPVWALKSPQLCYAAPYVLPFLSDPFGILMNRNFEASVASLVARDNFHPAVATHIQASCEASLYFTAGILAAQGITYAVVPYEDLLAEPEGVVRQLAEALPHESTEEQIQAAIRHVRPELRHH